MYPEVKYVLHLKHQDLGFTINRPEGNGYYTFFHFINPVDIFIGDRIVHTMPNACCILSPTHPQYICAKKFALLHDYICFSTKPDFPGVELNTLFYSYKQEEISFAVEDIQYNFLNRFDDAEDYLEKIHQGLQWLFILIRDHSRATLSSSSFSLDDAFKQLRCNMYASVKDWNVDNMAGSVHLSRSQFYRRYKEYFHVSPNEDIINAAMLRAENLLLFSNMTIADIAGDIGYSSVDYFIRCFKKKYGQTPGQYRTATRRSHSVG